MNPPDDAAALAAHKQRLIREGELYRVGVIHSKALLSQALHPEALLHGAVDQAIGVAQARFGALLQPGGLSGLPLKTMMPLLLTAGSYIVRKRLVKPALAVGVLVAAGAAWLIRRKRQ
jgi:hypothetical protein